MYELLPGYLNYIKFQSLTRLQRALSRPCHAGKAVKSWPWGPSALTRGPCAQELRSAGAVGKSDGRRRGGEGQ